METPQEFNKGLFVYAGNMSGGKTAKMILKLQRADCAHKKVQAFKISWDNRYEKGYITANNGQLKYPAMEVRHFGDLEKSFDPETEILAIDEIQFWDDRILDFLKQQRYERRIITTLIQHDFRGNPFPLRKKVGEEYKEHDSDKTVGEVLALSTLGINCNLPICTHKTRGKICGNPAPYVNRRNPNGKLSTWDELTIIVGKSSEETEKGEYSYDFRCPNHYVRIEEGD